MAWVVLLVIVVIVVVDVHAGTMLFTGDCELGHTHIISSIRISIITNIIIIIVAVVPVETVETGTGSQSAFTCIATFSSAAIVGCLSKRMIIGVGAIYHTIGITPPVQTVHTVIN